MGFELGRGLGDIASAAQLQDQPVLALGLGVADLAEIEVLETPLGEVVVPFKPHETTDLQLQWQTADAAQWLPTM
jgi:hypothetical protein